MKVENLIDSKVEIQRAINGVKIAIEQIGLQEGQEIAMGHTASSANRMAYTMKETNWCCCCYFCI